AQIVSMVKKLIPAYPFRTFIISSVLLLCLVIALSPIFISPEIGDPIVGQGQGAGKRQIRITEFIEQKQLHAEHEQTSEERLVEKEHQGDHSGENRTLEIRGYNTISELSQEYQISAEQLKASLKIPQSVSNNERLGRIRRTYEFTMSDVETAILKLKGS
ncbi:MAG: hypothetical protein R3182_08505, partial [Draconibacterium sp.]|nr:hypothetical protein [Draconibacterium sp.]